MFDPNDLPPNHVLVRPRPLASIIRHWLTGFPMRAFVYKQTPYMNQPSDATRRAGMTYGGGR